VRSAIAFEKYSLLGNTFLLVDEASTPLGDDCERAGFARWALDGYFGVGGADNVIYLASLNQAPDGPYSFRIFEQDGAETLSCGNGLLSVAALLARGGTGTQWRVLTELPTGRPRAVRVGVLSDSGGAWVDMGRPRAVPAALFRPGGGVAPDGVEALDDLRVDFPPHQDWAWGLPASITLSGWLVFTGEPHIVLVVGHGLPAELCDRLFPEPDREIGSESAGQEPSLRLLDSNTLVDHIGSSVNARYRSQFPHGVHLNLVEVRDQAGLLRYRTWERAINLETLACGTGALACAYVSWTRRLTAPGRTTLWPHRCRWYAPDAALHVTDTPQGLILEGRPRHVCSGVVPSGAWSGVRRARPAALSPVPHADSGRLDIHG